MEFVDYSGPAGFQNAADGESREYGIQHQHQLHHPYPHSLHDSARLAYYHPDPNSAAVQRRISCDIKPRLTKEQHDVLEDHYLQQPKPNTNTKKGFAESLGVSLDKVNVSGNGMGGCVRP